MRYKLSPLANDFKFVSIRITSKRYTLKSILLLYNYINGLCGVI